MALKTAVKENLKGRIAISGISGVGKTYTALKIAKYLAGPGGKVALFDTEDKSALRYADLFKFDTDDITDYSYKSYINALKEAGRGGYDVVILDSLSHAHMQMLEKCRTPQDWGSKARPLERELFQTIRRSPCHVICTFRQKDVYVFEEGVSRKTGKSTSVPKKVGVDVVGPKGVEFEFDIAGSMNLDHAWEITKTRCPDLSGKVFFEPGEDFVEILKPWLEGGESTYVEDESPEEKGKRIKAIREELNFPIEKLKSIMVAEYNATNPAQLSSGQIDSLIETLRNTKLD